MGVGQGYYYNIVNFSEKEKETEQVHDVMTSFHGVWVRWTHF